MGGEYMGCQAVPVAYALILIAAVSVQAAAPNAYPPVPVVLDVGHALKSPGAMSASGKTEFSLNQALAKDVSSALERLGISHGIVGMQGQETDLLARTRKAAPGALLVSIHHDSIQPQYMPRAQEFSGYSVFVSRKNPHPKASLTCAQWIGHYMLKAGYRHSTHHNEPIAGENRPWADETRGIYWFDDLIVLKTARQPAVLVEAGVIVNPKEEATITSPEGRGKIAQSIASGIAGCLGQK